jgi:L-threonylcarbamoyladenylate synthase
MVLDGGPSTIGVESTIVDVSERRPRVLRLGGITAEQLATVLGEPVPLATGGEVAAPGTLAQHYAPRARVELVEECDVERRVHAARAIGAVGLLALAGVAPDVTGVTVLDAPRDVDEYARVLYRRLREADAAAIDVLLVVPPPDTGIGAAVRDRLERAANR